VAKLLSSYHLWVTVTGYDDNTSF